MAYESIEAWNKEQKRQREARRHKKCKFCGANFVDKSKRLTQNTCSKKCSYKSGVFTRRKSGSYERTEEQNKKVSKTLKQGYSSGKYKMTEEMKAKISKSHKVNFSNKKKKEKILEKRKKATIKKFGVPHHSLAEEVREKTSKTNIDRYGSPYPTKNNKIKQKIINTKIKKGMIKTFEGKTMKEWASEIGVSYPWFKEIVGKQSFERAKLLTPSKKSNLECVVEDFLSKQNIEYTYDQMMDNKYKPDFFVKDFNLVIECDGLFWHSDFLKDKHYHKNKRNFYIGKGYVPLFFWGDEIEKKFSIVKSIILNKLGKSKKIYARKLKHGTCSNKFFEKNHLMGKGRGRIYSLNLDGIPQVAMQVKWKNKKEKTLEVSRFCTKLNTSVVGGWSRVMKKVINEEGPNKIITFVDLRYGSGEYLKNLGWRKINEDLSFKWTNGCDTMHRMKFPGNSGYEKGFFKVWDCGQAKWEKEIR